MCRTTCVIQVYNISYTCIYMCGEHVYYMCNCYTCNITIDKKDKNMFIMI